MDMLSRCSKDGAGVAGTGWTGLDEDDGLHWAALGLAGRPALPQRGAEPLCPAAALTGGALNDGPLHSAALSARGPGSAAFAARIALPAVPLPRPLSERSCAVTPRCSPTRSPIAISAASQQHPSPALSPYPGLVTFIPPCSWRHPNEVPSLKVPFNKGSPTLARTPNFFSSFILREM